MNPGLLLFAMDGLLSRLCLENILASTIHIKGVVLPADSAITHKPVHQVMQKNSIAWLANEHDIPVFYIKDINAPLHLNEIKACKPELILIACFPYRLPEAIIKSPIYGCYNIHPSLLPQYRGPVPLFWQFRDGIRETGMSIHRVEKEFDNGDIILQSRVSLPDGIDTLTAVKILFESISKPLPDILEKIVRNKTKAIKQNEKKSSYYSWPKTEDFHLDSSWDVQRAFNFMCGTAHWNQLYQITIDEKKYLIKDAVTYKKQRNYTKNLEFKNDLYCVPFSNGVLMVKHLIE